MSKRSWSNAGFGLSPKAVARPNPASGLLSRPIPATSDAPNGPRSPPYAVPSKYAPPNPTPSGTDQIPSGAGFTGQPDHGAQDTKSNPMLSRRVKACAACRKQKIKCIMNEQGPPCQRCIERNLSCVLNKNLQTIIDEGSQRNSTLYKDLESLHSSLQGVLRQLNLPALPQLQSVPAGTTDDGRGSNGYRIEDYDEQRAFDERGPTCDNSPRMSPEEDALLPIESLYQVTGLRALRKDENSNPSPSHGRDDDFIARGLISVVDAERLTHLYLSRIDHYMYGIGGKYKNLESLRRNSPILTVCICAVAALHDRDANRLYLICYEEFKRLMAASMFERRLDRNHLRAMVIASYWLSGISWTTSGYAIRRATEVNLSANYHSVIANDDDDAADCLRLFYILYICDQHLSILYGRPAIIRDDACVEGFEEYLNSAVATDDDRRLLSQVSLLTIIKSVRELLGPDRGEPIPRHFVSQISAYSRQLDQWLERWTNTMKNPHPHIGDFPVKGVRIHYHFAQLHLNSHVFRGLANKPMPPYLSEAAMAAVSAARSIVDFLLTDVHLRDGIVGMPHYIHTMIAFACVFLLKITVKYREEFIDSTVVYHMTSRLVELFRSAHTGQYHLVHLMADGLQRMVDSVIKTPTAQPELLSEHMGAIVPDADETDCSAMQPFQYVSGLEYGLSSSLSNLFDLNNFDAGDTGFGFLHHTPLL